MENLPVASRLSYNDVALCLSLARQFTAADSMEDSLARERRSSLDHSRQRGRRFRSYLKQLQYISTNLPECLEVLTQSRGEYEEAAYLLSQHVTEAARTAMRNNGVL